MTITASTWRAVMTKHSNHLYLGWIFVNFSFHEFTPNNIGNQTSWTWNLNFYPCFYLLRINSFLVDLYVQMWKIPKDIPRKKPPQTAGEKNEISVHLHIKEGRDIYTTACIFIENFRSDCSVLDWIGWEILLPFMTFYSIWPRQHIKKQRHHFANKGPSNQSYGFFQ